jgi:hypothetical protein
MLVWSIVPLAHIYAGLKVHRLSAALQTLWRCGSTQPAGGAFPAAPLSRIAPRQDTRPGRKWLRGSTRPALLLAWLVLRERECVETCVVAELDSRSLILDAHVPHATEQI